MGRCKIYDVTGRVIKNIEYDYGTGRNVKILDLSDLKPGIYFIKKGTETKAIKVVKIK